MGLLDGFFGPQQPGQPGMGEGLMGGMNTGVQNNANALMGMGMGLMSGNRATAWQNAMQGYMMGSMTDYKRAQDRKEEAERAKTKESIIRTAQALKAQYPQHAALFDAAGNNAELLTTALRTAQEEIKNERDDKRWSAGHSLDRERLDITKAQAERAANQPREVGNALVAPDPANPGQYRELYRAPGGNDLTTAIRTREQEAARLGLKPDSPGYQSYVLTGKMPREDAQPLTATDKKAIMEAEEGALASQGAIESLMRAKELSKKAYAGPMAGTRGYTTSLFGSEGGSATVELDNELKTNALNQLKAIFGGAPTEGERAILMEIQGSSALPAEVREKIYNKAIVLATRRLELNKRRAEELRTGNYYKSGEPGSGVPSIAPQGDPSVGGAPTRNPPGTGPRLLPPEPAQGGNPVYDLNGNRVR